MTRLALIPLTLAAANAFVGAHHRHHRPIQGHKFSLGAGKDGQLVLDLDDVVIRGMTVARNGEKLWPPPPVQVSAAPMRYKRNAADVWTRSAVSGPPRAGSISSSGN